MLPMETVRRNPSRVINEGAKRVVHERDRTQIRRLLVNFAPTIGAEVKKTRPAVVIQNDIGNRWSPITIVAAITSQFEDSLYPTEVLVRASEGGSRSIPSCS